MRRDDLMKPDLLSSLLLLSSSVILVAVVMMVMVLALVPALTPFSATSSSANYGFLPICCRSDSH